MSRKPRDSKSPASRSDGKPAPETPEPPINRIDGVPDVSSRRPWWKYAIVAGIFLAWAAFLLYCGLAANV